MWKPKNTAGRRVNGKHLLLLGAEQEIPNKIPQRHTAEFSRYGEKDRFMEKKPTAKFQGRLKTVAGQDSREYFLPSDQTGK